jgi:GNAT superfamily N-acetyltransferase
VLRQGTIEDIPQAAALRQRAWPERIITEEGMRHGIASTPARAEEARFAFEQAGMVVGWASAGRAWWQSSSDAGTLATAVDPGHRGEGIGTALAEAADDHLARLGIRSTRAMSLDEPAARALAARRGFERLGASSVSAVDPRTIQPLPIPGGTKLIPFAAVHDPRPIYELDLETAQDIPNEEYDAVSFEEWRKEYWKTPMIDQDASLAAYIEGRLAGVTMIRVDRPSGRAQNNLCGVRRQFRGRGLALLLKSHSLRRAAEMGATVVLTDNDETNAPMLAVNTKLGYRPFARRLEWERVGPTS